MQQVYHLFLLLTFDEYMTDPKIKELMEKDIATMIPLSANYLMQVGIVFLYFMMQYN